MALCFSEFQELATLDELAVRAEMSRLLLDH